jgi:CMP-N,N'-diacetyllegionaminic acid synthase
MIACGVRRNTESRRRVDYQLRPDRDLTILIPARAGSKRVPGKNTRLLGGRPLIQWTMDAAQAANAADVIVSTNCREVVAALREAKCRPHWRLPEHATDTATDFSWVYDLRYMIHTPYFCILRPTSPFRTASTIRRAFAALVGSGAHSVRAVERVLAPHPAKMWEFEKGTKFMQPVMRGSHPDGTYWHSSPTQSLPPVYKQNSSIEIAQTWVIEGTKTISGYHIAPFLTEDLEGFAIDTEDDWREAERLLPRFLGEDEIGYGHAV